MVLFGRKWLYSNKVVFRQKLLYSAKVVVFGRKWFYSDKNGCIKANVVVFGQSGCIQTKVLVIG